MDPFIQKDLDDLAERFSCGELLRGKRVLVTGGTGLIGSLLVRFLLLLNEKENLGINLYSLARNQGKILALNAGEGVRWIVQDMGQPLPSDITFDYIIHTASPTDSRFFVAQPVETITTAFEGTRNVLEYSRMHAGCSVIFLSSLEVYGTNFSDTPLKEGDYGFIDPLSPRSSYSEGKRLLECLCSSYFHEYGTDVKIIRLAQTFGCGISEEDNRVFAQFIRSVARDEDITLHTEGKLKRCYLYTTDALNAILVVLLKGKPGFAYNAANPETYISIRDMAELVAKRFGRGTSVKIELKEGLGYSPETRINMDISKIQGLGWEPVYSLEEMYRRTITYYRSLLNQKELSKKGENGKK